MLTWGLEETRTWQGFYCCFCRLSPWLGNGCVKLVLWMQRKHWQWVYSSMELIVPYTLAQLVKVMQCRHRLKLNNFLATLVKYIVIGCRAPTHLIELKNVWKTSSSLWFEFNEIWAIKMSTWQLRRDTSCSLFCSWTIYLPWCARIQIVYIFKSSISIVNYP